MNRLVNFFYEAGSLRKTPRAHRQSFLTEDNSDNIAAHSYRVAIIGYFLAVHEGADVAKVLTMCLLHDIAETRSGDQNWVHKRYVKVFEDEISREQLENLLPDNQPYDIISEYSQRKSLEAKITKDADRLEQALLVQEYAHAGNQEAKRWSAHDKEDEFFLDFSKQLYQLIRSTSPSDWWSRLYTSKRR